MDNSLDASAENRWAGAVYRVIRDKGRVRGRLGLFSCPSSQTLSYFIDRQKVLQSSSSEFNGRYLRLFLLAFKWPNTLFAPLFKPEL